ncbi:DUF4747 family protein [Paraburkholderia fungorum]|uniref:DUF4747 domain-containing protein n=1 Tax=Paraburkholderia fungorum TaxID=134537 RepID=A0AAW3V2F3_9BURK|nr:DUF4747 family protein [Paraburkholderia fungorum]MBB4515712.1 hypothetical protein [Paraburkholderia fungorum]MBB6203872.1 hypothetical protein [Paraburkholderia fungorum]
MQLLPINSHKQGDVGKEGYRKFFAGLRERVAVAVQQRKVEGIAYGLRSGMLFSAFTVEPAADYARGKFLKFDVAESVIDIYTSQTVFKASPGASAHPIYFRFAFDYDRHILAVEDTLGRLPSTGQFIKALSHLLEPVRGKLFPEHRLTIDQLTASEAVQKVFDEAQGFRRVHVTVTFANSDKFVRALQKELRDNNIHKVEHIERSDKDSLMDSPTEFGKILLQIAQRYGNASINYVVGAGKSMKRKIFRMKDHPVRQVLKEGKKETEPQFLDRVFQSIPAAEKKASAAVKDSKGT